MLDEYKYFRHQCGNVARHSTYATGTGYSGECYKCKAKYENIIFDRTWSEISENEFYFNS